MRVASSSSRSSSLSSGVPGSVRRTIWLHRTADEEDAAAMPDEEFPVRWAGRQAIVTFPAHIGVSNASQLSDRLLAVINRGAEVLVGDLAGTLSCDHTAVAAVARACQRAAIGGTRVQLVVTAPAVRRVLAIEEVDRLVPIYPSLEAATAATAAATATAATAVNAVTIATAVNATAEASAAAGTAARITPAVLWQLLDALGDGLLLAAHDGTIALVNRRCAEMLGYRREELTGLPLEALVPPELRVPHQAFRTGYAEAPEARPMAQRSRLAALRKDGATVPVEISLSPVPTASETFVLAVIRDATESRRRDDLADLARGVAAEQPQVTSDLLDRVVGRLFQVGLNLQAASGLPADVLRARLAEALDELDDAILQIRNYAFGSGDPAPLGTGWSSS
jgi:PAS domain S-box-containing protein